MGTYSSQLYGIKEDAHPIFYLELYPLRNPEWRYLALFFYMVKIVRNDAFNNQVMFMVLSSWRAIARVHPVHLMNHAD